MEIAANLKTAATHRHEKLLALAEPLFNPRVLLAVYVVSAILATLSKVLLKDIPYHGTLYHITHYRQLIVFGVYRAGFFHLIHHQDIYAAFPLEAPPDIFKYSPAFALFMAPFAALPYAVGAVLWNLLNAVAIFAGVWAIPRVSDRGKALILWFILLRVIENVQNAQSDALVAGLMVGAWAAMERGKPLLSSFCLVSSVFIKLFGGLALLPCLMVGAWRKQGPNTPKTSWRSQWQQRWRKLFGYLVMWTALLAIAPLAVVGPRQLLFLYRSWYARLGVDAATKEGLSVTALLQKWFHLPVSGLYVLIAGVAILLLVFLVRADAFSDFRFRLLAIASVLIFAVIFNHMSESTSMIIAVTGVALWYFLSSAQSTATLAPPIPRSSLDFVIDAILAALVLFFTVLFPTAIVPGAVRSSVMHGSLLVFSVPCMLVWLKLQYDLLRFPGAHPPARINF